MESEKKLIDPIIPLKMLGELEPMQFFETDAERDRAIAEGRLFADDDREEASSKVTPLNFLEENMGEDGCVIGQEEASSNSHDFPAPAHTPVVETTPLTSAAQMPANAENNIHGSRPSPYMTAKRLLMTEHFRTVGSDLYWFNGRYYEVLREQEAKRLILHKCRGDVERVGSAGHLKATYDLLLSEPSIVCDGTPSRRAVSFQNGLLRLDSGLLVPHTPDEFVTYGIQCDYLRSGYYECPNFDAFLYHTTGGNMELIERVWQIIGYILTPDTGAKAFFLFQGVPNSGKSVLTWLIQELFNPEAVSNLDVHALNEKFAVSSLAGKALCISPDLPSGPLDDKATSKLKQLTGDDMISADVKFKERVQFRTTAKIIVVTNHALTTRQHDEAFNERIVVVPFQYSVEKEQRDPFLRDRLKLELSAIATKAIAAYGKLVQNHYHFAGDYRPNTIVGLTCDGDMRGCVIEFLQRYFVADENGVTFMEDAYNLFIELYGSIPENVFSKLFSEYAAGMYHTTKHKKRRVSTGNPISCIMGIRLRIEGGKNEIL